jgi:hypothetical protein
MDRDMAEASRHWDPRWFRDQVKNGAPWGFKQRGPIYEDYGNFHYGATGLAFGFGEKIFQREAGAASYAADPNRRNMGLGDPGQRWNPFSWVPPYGDDPPDQEQIKKGFAYYKCKHQGRKN